SRKVDRRAVVRNRLKRVARDCFRRARHLLPPGDYVFMAKREASAAERAALRRDLERLFQRLLALKPPAPQVTMPAASNPLPAQAPAAGNDIPHTPSMAGTELRPGDDRASE